MSKYNILVSNSILTLLPEVSGKGSHKEMSLLDPTKQPTDTSRRKLTADLLFWLPWLVVNFSRKEEAKLAVVNEIGLEVF